MARWSGRLLRALSVISRVWASTLSEKRSHWRVLSKVTLLFSYFKRMAVPSGLRTDYGEGVVGPVWKQGDQVGGCGASAGKGRWYLGRAVSAEVGEVVSSGQTLGVRLKT